jgi:hypothetical protein
MDAVRKVINAAQSPFEETLHPSVEKNKRQLVLWSSSGTILSTLMCSLMGLQDPFKRKEDEHRNETKIVVRK